jgi:hypothetical protein
MPGKAWLGVVRHGVSGPGWVGPGEVRQGNIKELAGHGIGYNVIPAGKQPQAAIKRVGYARRKLNTARAINEYVRIEEMSPEQRLLQAQTAALLHDVSQTFNRASREFAAAATRLNLNVSPEDLKRIGDRRKKTKPPDSQDQTKAS